MACGFAAKTMFDFHTMHVCIDSNIYIRLNNLSSSPCHAGKNHSLVGVFGETLPNALQASTGFQYQLTANELDMEWPGAGHLKITHTTNSMSQHRYDVLWTSYGPTELRDIFQLDGANWYGAAQVRRQLWPIERWQMKLTPFIAGDSFKDGQFGGVQERYFLSSLGAAIFVDESVPLWVGINGHGDRLLRLSAKFQSPYRNPNSTKLFLQYSIFQGHDVRAVHDFVADAMISRPSEIPDEQMFRHPIWSTWATYKKNIDQETVLKFARDIRKQGFKAAQLEIDDDWTPAYGDMEFDPKKFPNPKTLVEDLRFMGFRVTLWVHPFASIKSSAFGRSDFWVRSTLTRGITMWWNGLGKCLDVTNPAAVAWYRGCLRDLIEKYGITSYKFDAGELSWLPPMHSFHAELKTPNEYTKLYAEMCAEIDADLHALEVRVGVRTQHLPVFVRMMDKDSRWDEENGLATLIPHVLTFGILGYPFALPDMVGGNAYNGLPDRELYVRWFEANALLPSIQISIPPWQYDDEVVRIAHKMLKLREDYADVIVELARESTRTGAPIIRPLWWVAPGDEIAHVIDSEFLLGENILVAPVLVPGATSRRVYLPAGSWRCELTQQQLEGGQWHDCCALIDQLPHFVRLESLNAAVATVSMVESVPESDPDSFEVIQVPTTN